MSESQEISEFTAQVRNEKSKSASFVEKKPSFQPLLQQEAAVKPELTSTNVLQPDKPTPSSINIDTHDSKPELSAPHTQHPAFGEPFYRFRRKLLKLFGGSYDIYNSEGEKILYSHQKEFRLREDFTVYDRDKTTPLLTIKSPQILDIAGVFHVQDPSGDKVGSLKRKWFKSIFKDEWLILDQNGVEIGKLAEASKSRALFSRLFGWLVPQRYSICANDGRNVASVRQHFNPIVLSYSMDVDQSQTQIDPRLLVASGILLSAVEKRQGSWMAAAHDTQTEFS